MYELKDILNLLDNRNEEIYKIRKILNELKILEVVESKIKELET
ncbi:MAG: hypothetical protein RR835_02280 [Peptostreptococcaceae bacterium]